MKRHVAILRNVLRVEPKALRVIAGTWLLRTDVERWRRVAAGDEPSLAERNCLIAQLIPDGSAVVDLGSGAQTLARYLGPGCTYQPCDCVKSSDNVLLCDFNRNVYPALDRQFDYAVVSGVLEYVRDPRRFLREIQSYGRVLLISYADLRPRQTRVWRASQGWVNHLSRPKLERIFADLGLVHEVVGTWHQQILYRIQKEHAQV